MQLTIEDGSYDSPYWIEVNHEFQLVTIVRARTIHATYSFDMIKQIYEEIEKEG